MRTTLIAAVLFALAACGANDQSSATDERTSTTERSTPPTPDADVSATIGCFEVGGAVESDNVLDQPIDADRAARIVRAFENTTSSGLDAALAQMHDALTQAAREEALDELLAWCEGAGVLTSTGEVAPV